MGGFLEVAKAKYRAHVLSREKRLSRAASQEASFERRQEREIDKQLKAREEIDRIMKKKEQLKKLRGPTGAEKVLSGFKSFGERVRRNQAQNEPSLGSKKEKVKKNIWLEI